MNELSQNISFDSVISLGDNFYFYGVTSITDPLWNTTWRDVYMIKSNLSKTPWYACLGNHDWYGTTSANAQKSYNSVDNRWNLPDYFYTKEYNISSNTSFQIIFMDSEPFHPSERISYPHIGAQSMELRNNWLNQTLIEGTGLYKYRFLVQHHPYYSA
jgi:tartrate-resistant acid phosphatase type 5